MSDDQKQEEMGGPDPNSTSRDNDIHQTQPPIARGLPPREKPLRILLDNVRKIWGEDYLTNVLLEAIYIDLGLSRQHEAASPPFESLNIQRPSLCPKGPPSTRFTKQHKGVC